MSKSFACLMIIAVAIVGTAVVVVHSSADRALAAENEGSSMLSHSVYFKLKEGDDAKRQEMVAACKKYLSKHPGTVFFAAGTVADEFDRPVNDREYDVALVMVFDSKSSHDAYQTSDMHLKFIAENRDNWDTVRVFDAYVEK